MTYEGGQRVSMIIYGKSIVKQPRVTNAMATNMGILLTILDLLKLEAPVDRLIDGKSMLPMITGNANKLRAFVFYNSALTGNVVGV